MFTPSRITWVIMLALSSAAYAEREGAPDYTRASLLERTPFSKPEKPGKPPASGPLELRGFFGSGDSIEVSLIRPGTNESAWIRVGDKTAKWQVESADPVAGTADVRYDGLLLHLKLARPELPEITVKPAADAGDGRAKRGGWSSLSPATQEILHSSMRESMEALRKSNPEYFDGTPLTEEQRKAFSAAREANFAKVREAVSKTAPEDLEKLDEMQQRMRSGGRRARGSSESSDAPAKGVSAAAPSAP